MPDRLNSEQAEDWRQFVDTFTPEPLTDTEVLEALAALPDEEFDRRLSELYPEREIVEFGRSAYHENERRGRSRFFSGKLSDNLLPNVR